MNAITAAQAGRGTSFPLKRKIAAILAADVAGYSRLVAEAEERTLTELAAARELFDAFVARSGGRIFNTAGDSVMCEFDSAVEAVRAAVDIQDAMRSRNAGIEARRRLEFRIGLTIGDVVERGGDLLGDGVNIAARLEGLAPPGGICVSRSVHEAVSNKLSVDFRELGARQVKNIPFPIHAYLVLPQGGQGFAPAAGRGGHREGGVRVVADTGRSRLVRRVALAAAVIGGFAAGVPLFKTVKTALVGAEPQAAAPAEPAREARPATPTPPRNEAATPPVAVPPARPAARPATTPPTNVAAKPPTPRDAKPTEPPRQDPPRPDAPRTPAADPPRTAASDAPRPAPAEPPARTLPADPAAAYASLARDGLLADARTLAELYHNARWLEAKGDRTGALAAYTAAAPLAGEYADVHLRYASLLRATRGAGAVRQAYAGLSRANPSLAASLVLALTLEGDERRARIEALAEAQPDVTFVDYLLADALAEGREGGPSLTERRLAFAALDRFIEAASSGDRDLTGRFVDRAFLESWLEAARRRRGEIEGFFASGAARPTASYSRTAAGWIGRLSLPEPASAISVRVGERGDFTPTGLSRTVDPKTGKPLPNMEVELPAGTGRVTLYVTYRDRSGRDAGPFPIAFDPGSAGADAGRAALERFPDSWVSFRSDLPELLSYAGLVSNRCAISRAAIGFGDDPPETVLPLPACDAAGPAALPSGASLVRLPDGTASVQVQLTYADGSESQVRTFRRP